MDAKTPMFPSAYDLKAPAGAEGWDELYPYYLKFQPSLREKEDQKFWFCDSQHWPNPFKPFDTMTVEFAVKCLGQYNTRHFFCNIFFQCTVIHFKCEAGYLFLSFSPPLL